MEQVVEEAVFAIPHLVAVRADTIHCIADPEEVLEESAGHLFIHGVVLGQNKRNIEHAKAVEGHPCGAVSLIQMPTSRQLRAAIEDPDIVESEKPAGEDVAPLWIFAVEPPAEVQHQSLERALEEL